MQSKISNYANDTEFELVFDKEPTCRYKWELALSLENNAELKFLLVGVFLKMECELVDRV